MYIQTRTVVRLKSQIELWLVAQLLCTCTECCSLEIPNFAYTFYIFWNFCFNLSFLYLWALGADLNALIPSVHRAAAIFIFSNCGTNKGYISYFCPTLSISAHTFLLRVVRTWKGWICFFSRSQATASESRTQETTEFFFTFWRKKKHKNK